MDETIGLLKKVLTELKISNVIHKESLRIQKEQYEKWQAVTEGIHDATERGIYRSIMDALEEKRTRRGRREGGDSHEH